MNVLVDDDGAVRTITLNRPEVRNAIDLPLRITLAEELARASNETAVRAIVLTGAGAAFCSGGDISTMQRLPEDAAMERAQLAQKVIRLIWGTPKPVVAAVEGSAFGAGTALAAACDLAIAARDVKFATTFLNVGLAGDMGVYASLPQRVGLARTRRMLMLGRTVDAETALDWGLVDELTEPGSALAQAQATAQILAGRPAGALGTVKSMLAEAPTLPPLVVLEREASAQARLFGSDDFAEGVAAFQQKRSPRFGAEEGIHQ